MAFNSIVFLLFLAVVFAAWRTIPARWGSHVLCVASSVFYAYWFPPFLLLLWTSGLVDYVCAGRMRLSTHPLRWLRLSLLVNLGILCTFKYVGFFLETIEQSAALFGKPVSLWEVDLLLPMGISFYTFQSMSYTIDVYRGRLEPCRRLVDFFAYLSFFPQLVAGPIVRATDFLPQLGSRRALTEADWQFVIHRVARGYFLKVVVADNIALSVNRVFASSPDTLSAPVAWLGVTFFAIQILCDFAGYSDIAIGIGRLFGFRIPENFNRPYSALGLQDFWHRWHISLSTWFRDYVYIPLGGSRGGEWRVGTNILVVFLLSGLWHGARMTFLFWGLIHGMGLLVEKHLRKHVDLEARGAAVAAMGRLLTFALVLVAWVPFRAPSVAYALDYWAAMFSGAAGPVLVPGLASGFLYAGLFAAHAWLARPNRTPLPARPAEVLVYVALVLVVPGTPVDFIYFQF